MEKIRLLVVDDSKVSHMMIEGILAKTEFEICGYAKTCVEAVEEYHLLKPEIVTMDMNLPDADGLECSRRILAINPKAKIVMISAMKDASLIMQGRIIGISSFLQKPMNENELIVTLQMLCQEQDDKIRSLEDSYIGSFVKSLQKNMFSLAGLHSKIKVSSDQADFFEVNGVAVIIGLTGTPLGRVVLHTDVETMHKFARAMLGLDSEDALSDQEACDSIEEAANIIAGGSVSMINDIFKDHELRITPPGTISGNKIRIVNPKLNSFDLLASTRLGDFKMNIGFAGGEE